MTESVLLGCLSTRFPKTTLEWDGPNLQITNMKDGKETADTHGLAVRK